MVSTVNLSNGGPCFSRIVQGLWRLDQWKLSRAQLLQWIETCLGLGITTFDHADIYGDHTCEALFGAALAEEPGLRRRMQLVTKCGIRLTSAQRPQNAVKHYDTSREHIISSVEQSLRNLRTDYVDLLLIHRPDPLMQVDEVASVFLALRNSGKVRFFGVSNFSQFQYDLLASRLDFPLVTNQVELSVLNMRVLRDGTVDQCQQRRISAMAWSPFSGGRLFTEDSAQAHRVRETLTEIAGNYAGAGIDHIALAWILRHPAVILPILGSGRVERIRRAASAEKIVLSREEWFRIWCASTGREVP